MEPRPIFGRAEPAPPRRSQPQVTGLAGENPDMTRKLVFSEGRTLCARMARPDACQGIPLPARGWARDRWLKGVTCRWNLAPIAGVQSPPLRDGVNPRSQALRGKAGDDAKRGFSDGCTLCVRILRQYGCPGIPLPAMVAQRTDGLVGIKCGAGPCPNYRRSEPDP